MYTLTNCTLYTGSCVLTGHGVLIECDKIVAISHLAELPAGIEQIDLKGANLSAGFIDVQLNGCGGVMFNGHITTETLATMQALHKAGYVTQGEDLCREATEAGRNLTGRLCL